MYIHIVYLLYVIRFYSPVEARLLNKLVYCGYKANATKNQNITPGPRTPMLDRSKPPCILKTPTDR